MFFAVLFRAAETAKSSAAGLGLGRPAAGRGRLSLGWPWLLKSETRGATHTLHGHCLQLETAIMLLV